MSFFLLDLSAKFDFRVCLSYDANKNALWLFDFPFRGPLKEVIQTTRMMSLMWPELLQAGWLGKRQ